jgi:hypothetical protein
MSVYRDLGVSAVTRGEGSHHGDRKRRADQPPFRGVDRGAIDALACTGSPPPLLFMDADLA